MFDENDLTVGPLAGEQFALPRREGPVDLGKAQETAMSHVGIGDYGNIRTIEFVQPDGTIARLRTRGGYPVFETDAQTTTASTSIARGFVAKVPSGRAVLFNPYTLAVLNSKYTPAGKNYTVQDFATTWGVPSGDATHWHDVVLADGSVKINAKTYSSFGSFGTLSETSIPHIINRGDAYDQYGNVELNLTQKRYFEVERFAVKTWGGAGSTSVLTPSGPRTDDKAMTIGPSVDAESDVAWLGQLYYTGALWSSDYGSWAISSASVSMLLTPPYLSKVSDTSPTEGSDYPTSWVAIASSGQTITSVGLPSVVVGVVGTGKISNVYLYNYVEVVWPWDSTFSSTLEGRQYINYTSRQRISGSVSEDVEQFGKPISVIGSNQKTWTRENRTVEVAEQYVSLPVSGDKNTGGATWVSDSSGWHWVSGPVGAGDRGYASNYFEGDFIPMAGTTYLATDANYDFELQEISFSATLPGFGPLVTCTISKTRYDGEDYTIQPVDTNFDWFLANPNSYISELTGQSWLHANLISDGNPAHDAEQWPVPVAYANSWVGTKYYAADLFPDIHDSQYIYLYNGIRTTKTNDRNATCAWASKDWILFDEKNGVYISVEGGFTGSGTLMSGTASLNVVLKVETRHHTTVVTLSEMSLSYGEFMPDTYTGFGGDATAIPSPKIPVLFLPLYQEQGSFKGAHYVTLDEETNGAAPAHLFNFLLHLKLFDSVGHVDSLNAVGQYVNFIPANLIEMLYSFVFSQQYGVGDIRYPVTSTARYNQVVSALFTNPYHISVRDGLEDNWTNAFGPDFAETSTISLHRT